MRYTLIILLCLFALSYIVFPASAYTFERPWNDYSWSSSNPYILIVANYEFWDPNVMQLSLESLNLSAARGYDYPEQARDVPAALSRSGVALESARLYRDRCNQEIDRAQWLRLGTLVISLLTGPSLTSSVTVPLILTYLQTHHLFFPSDVPSCFAYGGAWRSTLNNATTALEGSLAALGRDTLALNHSMDTLLASGACDDDYPGPALGQCRTARQQWSQFGLGQQALEYELDVFRNESRRPLPDFLPWALAMHRIAAPDSGLFDQGARISGSISSTMGQADSDYNSLLLDTRLQRSQAGARLQAAREEQLDLISYAPEAGFIFQTGRERNVRLALAELEDQARQAGFWMDSAERTYRSRPYGYLKNATLLLHRADEGYRSLASDADSLLEDARRSVQEQRQDAETQISKVEAFGQQKPIGPEARSYLSRAEGYMESAGRAATLGSQFGLYYQAAAAARTAGELAAGYSLNQTATLKGRLSRIGQLIRDAKHDGLEVSLEEAELSQASLIDPVFAFDILDSIESSILAKARLRYSGLESERRLLFSYLGLSPEFSDIQYSVERTEGQAFSRGRLDYPAAIGRLSDIEAQYRWAWAELEKQKTVVVGQALESDVRYHVDTARLDEPDAVSLILTVYNPTAFAAEDVGVDIIAPTVFALSTADIQSSDVPVGLIQPRPRGFALRLSGLEPRTRYEIRFEKSLVLASTRSYRSQTDGLGDGQAQRLETRSIRVDYAVPIAPAGEGTVMLDGRDYRGGTVAAGTHTWVQENRILDAWTMETGNYRSSRLGTRSVLDYDLTVNPAVALDTLTLFLPYGGERLDAFSVASLGGSRLVDKSPAGPGLYQVRLASLKANQSARLHVHMELQNATPFIEASLAELDSPDNTPAVRQLLEESRTALSSNQTGVALAKLEEARIQIEGDRRVRLKLQAQVGGLENRWQLEARQLSQAINDSGNSSHPLMATMQSRLRQIQEALQPAAGENLPQRLERLQSLEAGWTDKKIDGLLRSTSDDIGSIRKDFMRHGDELLNESLERLEKSRLQLESTHDLRDVPALLADWQETTTLAAAAQANLSIRKQQLGDRLNPLRAAITSALAVYSKQKQDARGTPFESFFPLDPETVSRHLKDAASALQRSDTAALEAAVLALESDSAQLNQSLETLRLEASAKLAQAGRLQAARLSTLSDSEKEKAQALMDAIATRIRQGDYVKALKAYEAFLQNFPSSKPETQDTGLLVLGVSAVFILGGFILYLLQKMGKLGPLQPPGAAGPKPFARLESAGERSAGESGGGGENRGEARDEETRGGEAKDKETQAGKAKETKEKT